MNEITDKFDRLAYNREFSKNNYYRLNVALSKDMRTIIDEAVARSGLSKNAFIREAIEEKIERLNTCD